MRRSECLVGLICFVLAVAAYMLAACGQPQGQPSVPITEIISVPVTPTPAAVASLPQSTAAMAPDNRMPALTLTPPQPAYTATTLPPIGPASATPDFMQMRVNTWQSVSPDGRWIAQGLEAIPYDASGTYYTQMIIERADGSVRWRAVDEWQEMFLGYTLPRPLHWSRNGRYFYFTNYCVPDGMQSLFENGCDVQRLDLDSGHVVEILPISGWVFSFSPDERLLAYIPFGELRLVIRDMITSQERTVRLVTAESGAEAGSIVWSPDGAVLALTVTSGTYPPTGWETSIVWIDAATLAQIALIAKDSRQFVTVAWLGTETLVLRDRNGELWWLNIKTGQVIQP